MSMTLLERLAWVIANRGVNASQWALRAGLTRTHVSQLMLRLEKNPDARQELRTMHRLADAAGVSRAWLAADVGVPDDPPESSVEEAEPPPQPKIETAKLSPNATEAMKAYDWDGVTSAEYDTIHAQLAQQHAADGIDRFPSWWASEIKRLLRELRGVAKKVHEREPVMSPEDRDRLELEAEKARRKAARAKKR